MGVDNLYRPRRTCLSVPGSSDKMIEKAKQLPADEVFLDVEAIPPGVDFRRYLTDQVARCEVMLVVIGPS